MGAKTRSDLDGLTLIKGQVSVDASAGVDVTDAHIIEFEVVGDATITYKDTTTDVYTVPNPGTRVSINRHGTEQVTTVTFIGNISIS